MRFTWTLSTYVSQIDLLYLSASIWTQTVFSNRKLGMDTCKRFQRNWKRLKIFKFPPNLLFRLFFMWHVTEMDPSGVRACKLLSCIDMLAEARCLLKVWSQWIKNYWFVADRLTVGQLANTKPVMDSMEWEISNFPPKKANKQTNLNLAGPHCFDFWL